MADITNISSLSLGNTFGAWYRRTNDIIAGLNYRKVASITGGDGIIVTPHPSVTGGYTLDIASTVSKTVTFGNNVNITGNLTVSGVLNYSIANDVSGTVMSLPFNTGVTLGNLVYIDSTGKAQKAKADDECTAEVAGIVVGFTGANAQVCTSGKFSGSSLVENFIGTAGATLIKGAVYFLSAGVSGAGTTLEPDSVRYVSKPVVIGITGNDGLFIVHRGFIGGTASSSSSVSGVCAGVSSLNASTAKLYASEDDFNNGILKTQGDLFSVVGIETFNGTRKNGAVFLSPIDPSVDLSDASTATAAVSVNYGYQKNKQTYSLNDSYFSNIISYNNATLYSLFTTSGVTSDVWKLKNIKYICEIPSPTKSESFALLRSINRLSTSNYINLLGHSDGANESPGTTSIFYGQKIIGLVRGNASVNGTYTPETSTTVLTPLINTPKDTQMPGGSPQPVGDGHTGGTLYNVININEQLAWNSNSNPSFVNSGYFVEPSSSGVFPVIYGVDTYTAVSEFDYIDKYTVTYNRSYRWNIESHVIGGAVAPFAGEWLKSSFEGTDLDLNSPSGYTCDTAILGWNAQYGAVSETLHLKMFTPLLYSNNILTKGCFYLEMKKYDINTKTEGETIIIPLQYQNYPNYFVVAGPNIPENSVY